MNTKNNVKQRRDQKIKFLREQGASFAEEETADYRTDRELRVNEPQSDPEKAWKSDPNRWAGWNDEREWLQSGSYVKRALPTKDKLPSPPEKHSFLKDLRWKILISMILFSVIWLLHQYDNKWTSAGQAMVKHALTDELDFKAAADWYNSTFAGAPSFIPIFKQNGNETIGADGRIRLPVSSPLADGVLVRTFAELLNGVELAGKPSQQVLAAEEGRVLLAESNENSASIVIQHAGKRVTIYGKLGDVMVKPDDWVQAGDPIGYLREQDELRSETSLLYFAVKQDGVFVDPLGVIPLD